jgi:hypothetical protein
VAAVREAELTEYDLLNAEVFRLARLTERVHARRVSRETDGVERAAYMLLVTLVKEGPRASTLAATEAGRQNLDCKRRKRNQAYTEMLADWSADDRSRLHALLERFNNDFEGFFLDTPVPAGGRAGGPAV